MPNTVQLFLFLPLSADADGDHMDDWVRSGDDVDSRPDDGVVFDFVVVLPVVVVAVVVVVVVGVAPVATVA